MEKTTPFITNDFAANDSACQQAMAAYLQRLQREEAHRQAIRDGHVQPAPWGVWNVSDRD